MHVQFDGFYLISVPRCVGARAHVRGALWRSTSADDVKRSVGSAGERDLGTRRSRTAVTLVDEKRKFFDKNCREKLVFRTFRVKITVQSREKPTRRRISTGTRSPRVFLSTANTAGRQLSIVARARNNRWPDRWSWLPPFPRRSITSRERFIYIQFCCRKSQFPWPNSPCARRVRRPEPSQTAQSVQEPRIQRAAKVHAVRAYRPQNINGWGQRVAISVTRWVRAPRQPTLMKPFCWRPCLRRARIFFSRYPSVAPCPHSVLAVFPRSFTRYPSYFYGARPIF